MKVKFYSAVRAVMDYTGDEFNEYKSYFDNEFLEKYDDGLISYLQPEDIVYYVESINDVINEKWFNREKQTQGLMKYFCFYTDNNTQERLLKKVCSAFPKLEVICDKAFVVIECEVNSNLTDREIGVLKNFFSSQYFDGWGEEFEQQGIFIDDGAVYVAFCDDNFTVETEQEFFGKLDNGLIEESRDVKL